MRGIPQPSVDVSFVTDLKHCWTNGRIACDLRRHDAHVISLMIQIVRSKYLRRRMLYLLPFTSHVFLIIVLNKKYSRERDIFPYFNFGYVSKAYGNTAVSALKLLQSCNKPAIDGSSMKSNLFRRILILSIIFWGKPGGYSKSNHLLPSHAKGCYLHYLRRMCGLSENIGCN